LEAVSARNKEQISKALRTMKTPGWCSENDFARMNAKLNCTPRSAAQEWRRSSVGFQVIAAKAVRRIRGTRLSLRLVLAQNLSRETCERKLPYLLSTYPAASLLPVRAKRFQSQAHHPDFVVGVSDGVAHRE
jgi:hypothetical protein